MGRRYRSTLRRAGLALHTCAPESSLLHTLTACRYGTSNTGDPQDGRGRFHLRGKPSLDHRCGGALSLEWATWVMGFPPNWTATTGGP